MLWVSVAGVLPVTLLVGLCYLPPKGSGGCPADLDGWWLRMADDVAAAEALGLIILAGDFNARRRRPRLGRGR